MIRLTKYDEITLVCIKLHLYGDATCCFVQIGQQTDITGYRIPQLSLQGSIPENTDVFNRLTGTVRDKIDFTVRQGTVVVPDAATGTTVFASVRAMAGYIAENRKQR